MLGIGNSYSNNIDSMKKLSPFNRRLRKFMIVKNDE